MSVEKDIQAAIEKNLPSATAKILAKRLEDGEAAVALVETLQKENAKIKTDLKEFIGKESKIEYDSKIIAESLKHIAEQKTALEIEAKVAEAVKKEREEAKGQIFKLVETVFKNPVVRQHTQTTETVPFKDQYGAMQYGCTTGNRTTETEVEGTK